MATIATKVLPQSKTSARDELIRSRLVEPKITLTTPEKRQLWNAGGDINDAIWNKDTVSLEAALDVYTKFGGDLNKPLLGTGDDRPPIFIAVVADSENAVEILFNRRINPLVKYLDQQLIFWASRIGNSEILDIIASHTNVNSREALTTPLLACVTSFPSIKVAKTAEWEGGESVRERLLRILEGKEAPDADFLPRGLWRGDLESIDVFLNRGADPLAPKGNDSAKFAVENPFSDSLMRIVTAGKHKLLEPTSELPSKGKNIPILKICFQHYGIEQYVILDYDTSDIVARFNKKILERTGFSTFEAQLEDISREASAARVEAGSAKREVVEAKKEAERTHVMAKKAMSVAVQLDAAIQFNAREIGDLRSQTEQLEHEVKGLKDRTDKMMAEHLLLVTDRKVQAELKERFAAVNKDILTRAFYNGFVTELNNMFDFCKKYMQDPSKTDKLDAISTLISHAPAPFNVIGTVVKSLNAMHNGIQMLKNRDLVTLLLGSEHLSVCNSIGLKLFEKYTNYVKITGKNPAEALQLGRQAAGSVFAAVLKNSFSLDSELSQQMFDVVISDKNFATALSKYARKQISPEPVILSARSKPGLLELASGASSSITATDSVRASCIIS